jgi:hypothetical protein
MLESSSFFYLTDLGREYHVVVKRGKNFLSFLIHKRKINPLKTVLFFHQKVVILKEKIFLKNKIAENIR